MHGITCGVEQIVGRRRLVLPYRESVLIAFYDHVAGPARVVLSQVHTERLCCCALTGDEKRRGQQVRAVDSLPLLASPVCACPGRRLCSLVSHTTCRLTPEVHHRVVHQRDGCHASGGVAPVRLIQHPQTAVLYVHPVAPRPAHRQHAAHVLRQLQHWLGQVLACHRAHAQHAVAHAVQQVDDAHSVVGDSGGGQEHGCDVVRVAGSRGRLADPPGDRGIVEVVPHHIAAVPVHHVPEQGKQQRGTKDA